MKTISIVLVVMAALVGACGKMPTAPTPKFCGPTYWITDTVWNKLDTTRTQFIVVQQKKGGCVY